MTTIDYARIPGNLAETLSAPKAGSARLLWFRRVLSLLVVSVFIIVMLSYGISDTVMYEKGPSTNRTESRLFLKKPPSFPPRLPDFSLYGDRLQTLSSHQLHFRRRRGRLIIVGDIHGMKDSLDLLLRKLDYNRHRDVFIHTGDFLTKNGVASAMEVLEVFTSKGVYGVRGNNDQKIIEWRSWFDWVRSFPDGPKWLDEYVDDTVRVFGNESTSDVASRTPHDQRFPIPEGWKWGSQHWKIAQIMTDEQFDYLISLPLILHLPLLHTMIVHAGLLPLDPTQPLNSKHQPLSRIPSLSEHLKHKSLRTAQEVAVVEHIPQNQDPWNILNLRTILPNGSTSRSNEDGEFWPHLWNSVLNTCSGFSTRSSKEGVIVESTSQAIFKKSRDTLPCYPFTVVYGHMASKGLNIRRWTKGLDTGCVYGNNLTALVYSEASLNGPHTMTEDIRKDITIMKTKLGDNPGKAHIVGVSCGES